MKVQHVLNDNLVMGSRLPRSRIVISLHIHIAAIYKLKDLMRFEKTVECHEKLPWLYLFFIVNFLQVYGSLIFMSLQDYNSAPLVYFLRRV